jgi:sarcosine oxidase
MHYAAVMRADVIVVGLGTMGSAAVEVLSRRGIQVIGLDRWAPPHERGAHAGGSRIIRLAYAASTAYVPLLRRSYELWDDLQRRGRRRLFTQTGGLTIGRRDWPLVSGVLEAAASHGIECERLTPDGLADRFPQFRPSDGEVAVLDVMAGVLAPEAAIDTCLSLAEVAGARLDVDITVTGWHANTSGVTVHTSAGDVTGDRLVLCPGAGAPALLADLAVPWRVERRLQHYWRPAAGRAVFGHPRFPVWMWEYSPDAVAYGLPWQDPPGGVKTAFHHANAGPAERDPVDVDMGAVPATPDEAAPMREWLAPRLPAIGAGEWLGAMACLYTLTPDEHFVLGPHPAHENVIVAAGFSGHGFKFLPVVGEILGDLALDGVTRQPIGLFAPGRFATQPD